MAVAALRTLPSGAILNPVPMSAVAAAPAGLVKPLPKLPDGREPIRTHEFEAVKHLGVDVMYRYAPGDSTSAPQTVSHVSGPNASRVGVYSVPLNKWRIPVLAVAPGKVVYAKQASNGWRTRVRSTLLGAYYAAPFCDVLDLHMTGLVVQAGEQVQAGQMLGWVGGDPSENDAPNHTIHDHHEHRVPATRHTMTPDGYGTAAVDPWPLLENARAIAIPLAYVN